MRVLGNYTAKIRVENIRSHSFELPRFDSLNQSYWSKHRVSRDSIPRFEHANRQFGQSTRDV